MNRTLNQVQEVVSVLTANEQQLLKDTINYGSWGGDEWDFINGYGDVKTVLMHAYCTDDAIKAGHFTTIEASSMWTSIYKKLCQANNNEIGQFISHVIVGYTMVVAICCSSEQPTTKYLRNGLEGELTRQREGFDSPHTYKHTYESGTQYSSTGSLQHPL